MLSTNQKSRIEYVDKRRAKWILDNFDKLDISPKQYESNFVMTEEKLMNYLERVISSKRSSNPHHPEYVGEMQINYSFAKKRSCGRVWASDGFQMLIKTIRHTLCKETYYDVDIINCHPCLLLNLCQKLKIPVSALEQYVMNREQLLNSEKFSRSELKNIFLHVLNGKKQIQIPDELLNSIPLIKEYLAEIDNITNQLIGFNPIEFKEFVSYIKEKRGDKKVFNSKGKYLNHIISSQENELLSKAVEYIEKRGIDVNSLIFDGFMIHNLCADGRILSKDDMSALINDLNDHIKVLYGVDYIVFSLKSFDYAITIPENELVSAIQKPSKRGEALWAMGRSPEAPTKKKLANVVNQSNKPKPELVIVNDIEGVNYIVSKLGRNIILSNGRFFIKRFGNIYSEDTSREGRDVRTYLINFISEMNIEFETKPPGIDENGNITPGKSKPYSKMYTSCIKLADFVISKFTEDQEFSNQLWNSSLKRLCFKNGYIDFHKGPLFNNWENSNDEFFSTLYVNRDYNPVRNEDHIKEVYDKVINPILTNEQQRNYFLSWLSRGLAGHISEKTWAIGLGRRNSGKGVINELLRNTFGKYVVNFNAEELILSNADSGDKAKKYAWMKDLEYSRIAISNELSTLNAKGKTIQLDSSQIKSLSSGGDSRPIRQNFKDQVEIRIQARMLMFANEMAPLSKEDVLKTLTTFQFRTEFKDTDLTERELEINQLGEYTFMKGDDNIKEYILQDYVKDAFVHIILDHYNGGIKPIMPELIIENTDALIEAGDNIKDKLSNAFIITLDPKDSISVTEMNLYLTKDLGLSKSSASSELLAMGVRKKNTGTQRLYIGIKFKHI